MAPGTLTFFFLAVIRITLPNSGGRRDGFSVFILRTGNCDLILELCK